MAVYHSIRVRILAPERMSTCRFCNRKFEVVSQLGGHAARCASNPNRAATRDKTSKRMIGKKLPEHIREKVSATALQKVKDGTWHNSLARSRQHLYKNEKFDGTWEVMLATWFDSQNITWKRNKNAFPYIFDKMRCYTPDFYLPDIDCYIEVKGWKTSKDDAKWKQFPEKLLVLSGGDLKTLGLPVSIRTDWK